MRLRNNPEAESLLLKSEYAITKFPTKINKNTVIELGMGKGEMITQLAFDNPDKQYIGIEKFATVAHKAMKRAENLGIKNFKIILADIKNLPELLDGQVDTIWLTFSDPWPKVRHEKRRLTYKTFLDLYKEILSDNGVLKFKTDNDKLFEYSVEHMKENKVTLSNVTRDFHSEKYSKGNVMTGYEEKWSSQGKNINYLEARFK